MQTVSATVDLRSPACRTILLVDDEPDLLHLAALYLRRLGYRTLEAGDAEAALRLVAQQPCVDLLLTDVLMPGSLDGFDLAQRVRALCPAIAVLYTSGFPSDALAQGRLGKGVDPMGVDRMLQKPYRLAELAEAVQAACAALPAGPPQP